MICSDTIQILFIKTPFEYASLIARGTFRLEWTGITRCRSGLIAFLSLRISIGMKGQDGLAGADVDIAFRIVAKRVFSVQGRPVVEVWERNVRSDVLLF